MTKEEKLRKALSRAFCLGENHWMYSDSEFPSQWKNADVVLKKYQDLVEQTIKEILDDQNS